MPTAQDYANAANRLDDLSQTMHGVIDPTNGQRPPAQLTGGLLAAQVDELVTRRSNDSATFATGLVTMADECRSRQAQAAALDAAWDTYDAAYAQYLRDIDQWEGDRDVYVADPFTAPHPGSPPEPPSPPAPIPDWYDRS